MNVFENSSSPSSKEFFLFIFYLSFVLFFFSNLIGRKLKFLLYLQIALEVTFYYLEDLKTLRALQCIPFNIEWILFMTTILLLI